MINVELDCGKDNMTHGYEWLFEYDMVDLDDYYTDVEDFAWDESISEAWDEIDKIYDEYQDDWGF